MQMSISMGMKERQNWHTGFLLGAPPPNKMLLPLKSLEIGSKCCGHWQKLFCCYENENAVVALHSVKVKICTFKISDATGTVL